MPNKVLETKNLNAYYGDFQALFEVSIDLFEGEIIAIIGANGAGKSTFMRSVTGLIDRIDNEINYKGLSINCLLYTSPSPRDLSTSRMPSSA